jgi:hypothetical protein
MVQAEMKRLGEKETELLRDAIEASWEWRKGKLTKS